jgi:hypothetical protein
MFVPHHRPRISIPIEATTILTQGANRPAIHHDQLRRFAALSDQCKARVRGQLQFARLFDVKARHDPMGERMRQQIIAHNP